MGIPDEPEHYDECPQSRRCICEELDSAAYDREMDLRMEQEQDRRMEREREERWGGYGL